MKAYFTFTVMFQRLFLNGLDVLRLAKLNLSKTEMRIERRSYNLFNDSDILRGKKLFAAVGPVIRDVTLCTL